MKKRLLSAITAVTLLLGTFPAGMTFVSAEGETANATVEYNRLLPEVAILNQYTGNSSSFYTSLKGALKQETGTTYASYPDYNAVQALYGGDSGMWSWKAIFGDSDTEVKLSWNPLGSSAPTFADSALKQVMETKNNLYVKMSAEFQNYTHKHTFWDVIIPKQVEVHNFLSGKLSIGGNTTLSISGLDGVGLSNYRDGDDDAYYPLNHNGSDDGGGITFTKAKIAYTDGKTCNCSGATADHLLVTFRDDRAPKVSAVEYSSDGTNFGDRFRSGMKKQLGAGDNLYIKLTFDEPIRFSDDSAEGKESLNLGLKMQGKDVWDNMRATLYKLDNNALYFKYTVPSDLGFDEENKDDEEKQGLDADIISLDASSLYNSNKTLKLKQVSRGSGSFEISDTKLADLNIKDSYGFNTTDCYITDLAGNAWEETEITNAYLHIDTKTPAVESINWGLNLNNADVKEALGSSNAGDNSDIYLGVGDSINMTVAMSEPLDIEPYKQEGTGYPLYDWKHAVATTNIKDKNGKYVTITSRYYTPLEQNKHRLQNTVFVMQGLTIEEGMYVEKTTDNPNGEVRVTKFDLSDPDYKKDIADMRGNTLDKDDVIIYTGAGSNPPMVATAPPTVTEVAKGYFGTDDGFRQAVAIEDEGGTGVAGIYGSFTLNHSGDSGAYRYLWATSASADASGLTWNTGVTGEAQRFIQHETTYFHIKQDPNEDYVNLNSCVLTVNAKDYAGNIGSCTVDSSTITWYVDNLPPTVTAGDMTRTLNGDSTGTLYANVTLCDSHGISAWQYGWSDDEATEPTSWEMGDTTGIASQETALVTVSQTVNMGDDFGKYLWVKAADKSKSQNNSGAVCMGKYTYNLSQAKYVLKHTAAITKTPEIAVSSMDLEDSLVVAVRKDDDESYYFKMIDCSSYTANQNIFGGSDWQKGNLTATETGCSIQITDYAPSVAWMTNGNYAGNLEVLVFAGRTDGLKDDGSPIIVGGDGYSFSKETVTLRVNGSGTYAKRNHSISLSDGDMQYVQARLTEDLQIRNEKEIWSGDTNLLDTLAGKQVEIVVTKDRYGWNCEDIDLQKSKLILTNQNDTSDIHEFALTQFRKIQEEGTVTWQQRITLGGEFATGIYTAELKLALVNAEDGEEVTIMVTDKDGHPTDIAPLTVDATVPNENLQLSAITYGHGSDAAYQLNQEGVYPERNCIGEDDVAILPMAGGYFEPTGDPSMFTYAITFTSEGEKDLGALYDKYNEIWTYTGQYRVEVWDKANPDKVVKFYPYQNEDIKTGYENEKIGYTEACSNNGTDASNEKRCGITVNANGKNETGMIYLTPDTEEGVTLCYRKVYANGRTTTTREQVVRPVTSYLTGTMSIDEKNKELVFTPTSNEATNKGATVYALAYQNTDDWEQGGGERIAMGYAADGTWRCNLKENGAIYRILTINQYGSVWASEKTDCLAQRAPWTSNNGNTVSYQDNGDGTYTASVWLYDDPGTIRKDGLDLEIGFHEAYGAEGYGIHVTDDLFGDGFRYTEKTKGLSRNGIYEVYLEASSGDTDCLYVKIQGVVQKQDAETQTGQTMNLTLRATDAFGNRWEGSTGDQTVTYREPKVSETALGNKGLKVTFNQPVLPTESWAWVESLAEETDYQTVWEGAFPVTSNGEHTIRFKDIFGNVCEDTFSTDAFTTTGDHAGDWSMNLTLSETELTQDAVKLTASLPYANAETLDSGTSIRDSNSDTMVPEGRYNGYPFPTNPTVYDRDKGWTSDNSGATSTPRTVSTDKNGIFTVGVYHNTFVHDGHPGLIYSQKVYINNIANEAPDAELLYYNSLWGSEFTKAELEDYIQKQGGTLTLEDTVRVRYRTTRHVTATEGGSEVFFTVDNQGKSHTFSYQDDMGNGKSVTATLPTGLTLQEPSETQTYTDTTPPTVSVGIWYEYKGVYKEAEGFVAGETEANITEKVQNLGAVSAVGFKILASDESGFDISFTATDGEGGAVGADDVTLEGNMLTVRKAADITVTVTDRATTPNSTTITLKKAMFDKLDNTPPTATISTVADGMYGRKVIIELSDTNNKGEDTSVDSAGNDAITLTAPSGAKRIDTNKYEYTVTENGTVNFVFYDRAGNRNKSDGASADVTGIDTNPPVLTVTWAPPLTYWDDLEEKTVTDHSEPTSDVVSTNVTAFIDSDKTLKSLSLEYGGDPIELLDSSAANYQNPYRILGQDNKVLATVTATSERVSVEYEEYYGQDLNFTATAANGRSATKTVTGYVSIDKEAPTVTVSEPVNLYRTKADGTPYTVPYAVKFTLTPNEAAYSSNYGESETVDYGNGPEEDWKYYTEDEPLTITFTENGTYAVYFSDIAGNSTVKKVTVSGIDRTAPVITLGDRTESGQSVTVAVTVDEASTVTADNTTYTFAAGATKEITFTDNATYAIVAVDDAGNESRRTIVVGSIDRVLPSISFYTNTVYAIAGGDRTAADDELQNGYAVSDNKTKAEDLVVTKDVTKIKWDTAGLYPVKYTVTDEAGNTTEATRFVQIIGKNTVCASVDGKVILPNSTAVLRPGSHKLELQNSNEPYSVKARLGIRSLGQMKNLTANSLTFDEDGNFTVGTSGYYTLQITTQSRQVIRILLYVEP